MPGIPDKVKVMKERILYALSIFVPVAAICGTGIICLCVSQGTLNYKVAVTSIAVTVVLVKVSGYFRVEFRQQAIGNSVRNTTTGYKYLSKKQRDVIDMITRQQNEAALSEREFRSMLHNGSKKPDEDLESLTGLQSVKEKVLELKAQMIYGGKKEQRGFNMCFLGNPGTGKTTVAGIITGYLHKYHFLKRNQYVVVDGASLVSSADPMRRVNLLLARSKGKLLFIDEAYAIAFEPYGNSVLTAILNEMESDRKNTMVIFAGYKKEMHELFKMNSGLQSRINTYIFFEDYVFGELKEIIKNMLKYHKFDIAPEALEKTFDIFKHHAEAGTFANARSARNICEDAIGQHRVRLMTKQTNNKYLIEPADIIEHNETNKYFSEI